MGDGRLVGVCAVFEADESWGEDAGRLRSIIGWLPVLIHIHHQRWSSWRCRLSIVNIPTAFAAAGSLCIRISEERSSQIMDLVLLVAGLQAADSLWSLPNTIACGQENRRDLVCCTHNLSDMRAQDR